MVTFTLSVVLLTFPTLIYLFILNDLHGLITTRLYKFVRHKETKFFLLSFVKFMMNVGASVASMTIIGYFIPQRVEVSVLLMLGVSGIIMAMTGYYAERFLRD